MVAVSGGGGVGPQLKTLTCPGKGGMKTPPGKVTVRLRVSNAVLLPQGPILLLVALMVTGKTPTPVGVPEISPVVVPTVAVAVSGLVMTGSWGQIVMTSVAVALLQPVPLLTVIVTLVVPAAVGVPETTFRLPPLPNDKPAGNGAAV